MYLKVDKPINGRRFVIPDIHGFPKTLEYLIRQIALTKNDQLFFLGDYIDRGPSSAAVLDIILGLQNQGYAVYCLRGNHEEDFLQDYRGEKKKKNDLLDAQGTLPDNYETFLNSLLYFIELDRFYLVHAGFNFESNAPLQDYENMLRTRVMTTNTLGKTIVHGHNVTRLSVILEKLEQKADIIPLDNGLYYSSALKDLSGDLTGIDVGNLTCLNLDTYELIIQGCKDY